MQFNPTQFRVQPLYPGLKRILNSISKEEREYREQRERTRERPLSGGSKRTVMIEIDLAKQEEFFASRLDEFDDLFDSFSSQISRQVRSKSFVATKTSVYDAAWGIPSQFKMPAFWKPEDLKARELERGFCAGFARHSFNSNAAMSDEQRREIEKLLA